jgi:hypothetical protein
MLTLAGAGRRYCDGVSRRSFLKIGSLAMGGIGLPALLQAEQQRGGGSSHKAVIMVYLSGGLSHHDTFDMKPDAPAEIAGEFRPVATRIPGIRISEHLPRLAGMMDKLAVVRSIVGLRDEHSSYQTLTGYTMDLARREGRPNAGSMVSRVLGPTSPIVPAFVDLFPTMQHRPYNIPGPGFVGPSHAGAKFEGDSLAVMQLRDLTLNRFEDRRQLLQSVDALRRTLDNFPLARMDTSYRQAFDVLTSRRLVEALDLDKEPRSVRDRYGHGSPRHQGDGAPLWNDQLLTARRLVEAGVRCVTVAYGFWDTHGGNFRYLRNNLPVFDRGISALIEDIHQRGLARDVTVLVWGEIRPHAAHQSRRRPRPLGARQRRPSRRRRHDDGPGRRRDRQIRRLRGGPPRPLPRHPRHRLPQPRHRSPRHGPRPRGPPGRHSARRRPARARAGRLTACQPELPGQ